MKNQSVFHDAYSSLLRAKYLARNEAGTSVANVQLYVVHKAVLSRLAKPVPSASHLAGQAGGLPGLKDQGYWHVVPTDYIAAGVLLN